MNEDVAFLWHINNDLIAVSLAPDGATAKHGEIAPQQIQEFVGGAIIESSILKGADIMSEKTTGGDLIGGKKEKTVQTKQLLIQGHLLRWEGVIIQISNISLITSTNLNPPRFPIWAAIAVLAGISLLDPIWYVGLIAMAVGGYSIYSWYSEYEEVKSHKYLNILLNSGFTYSILFSNEAFLDEVMHVFANIFEDGAKANTNYYIDIKNSTISNDASVVRNVMR